MSSGIYIQGEIRYAKDDAWYVDVYNKADDFILATNKTTSIKKFLELCLKVSELVTNISMIKIEILIVDKSNSKILKLTKNI